MEYFQLFLVFTIHYNRRCLAIGECKNGQTVVATVTQKSFFPGTKDTGFTITCEVNIIDPTYVISTWRLERPSSVFIYTYIPPSTFAPGADYATRNLKFTNLDTVVFPSYESTDVRKEDLTCYLSLNSNGFTCIDVKELNIFAKPSVTVESTPELSNSVVVDTEITMDITGTDYRCFEDPTFRVQIGSAPARPLTLSPSPTPGDFSTFTASLKFTATDTESGNINIIMTCGGDTATISTDIVVQIELKVLPGPALPIGGIIGGILGGVACFILVAGLLVILWRRKQNKGGDRERLGKNDQNEEIGVEARQTENTVVIYAEVKKKKKPVTDIYTAVNEPEKKRQKKDPTPASKSKRARDVYEMPSQYGDDANTYANAGFERDEAEAKNENPQPPTGRDADGCLYVGINFRNKKPGKVIIGREKGSYVDIAYGKVGPPPPPDEDEEDDDKKE